MDAEGGVRYVVAGNPTGWAAMAKTIRDVDEDKIKDCKEDIDTLLVFTGLFSAVLSAFLIESYRNLSPDKTDTMIQLLGQISNQTNSYVLSGSSIRSTVPPLAQSQPPFTPSPSALRVNELWFASLIISLAIASFSMLVKQWLREYLAVDFTSPHERLRARQFRHPGLSEWKVFEIAGILPLLLQLALGLFLLGLCFFTWGVHPTVGNTSTVLVAGWAFFFICATTAPISSPRCPYKTALLKRVMVSLRRRIAKSLYPTNIRTGLRTTLPVSALDAISRPSTLFPSRYFVEEEDAVKQDVDEVAILTEVDAVLLDDELLGTTIFDSLTQNNAVPSTVIKFVLQALESRISGSVFIQPLTSIPDLRRLSKRGWVAVSDIVATTILQAVGKHDIDRVGGWLKDAVRLLLSFSDQPLTPKACNALVRCTEKLTASTMWDVVASLPPSANAQRAHVAFRIYEMCEALSPHICNLVTAGTVSPPDLINFVLKLQSFDAGQSPPPSQPLDSILQLQSISRPLWDLSMDTIGAAVLQATVTSEGERKNVGSWLEEALYLLLSSSQYPQTSTSYDALAQCIKNDGIYLRFGRCIRPMVGPTNVNHLHIISCLRHVYERLTTNADTTWLLKEIILSPECDPGCTHRPENKLAHLVHDHVREHEDWAKYYISFLLDCIQPVLELGPSASWPPGAWWCLGALISCPYSVLQCMHPGVDKFILPLFCSRKTAGIVLEPFISVNSEAHSVILYDAAVSTMISLIGKMDSKDRGQLFYCMWDHVDDYMTVAEKSQHSTVRDLNPIRLCAVFLRFYSPFQSDTSLRSISNKFCVTCAQAMSRFMDAKYSSLEDKEREDTTRLAGECLTALDLLEQTGAPFDEWVKTFSLESSVFPDELFEHLALFVSEEVALRSMRVQRLRGEGVQRTVVGSNAPADEARSDHPQPQVQKDTELANGGNSEATTGLGSEPESEALLELLRREHLIPDGMDMDQFRYLLQQIGNEAQSLNVGSGPSANN